MKTTQDHSVEVVMDIVKRYAIDGVHIDDSFYPYESYVGEIGEVVESKNEEQSIDFFPLE